MDSRRRGRPVSPAQLLSHFDRISDAPDAIPRLRQFILDLAVRGKLVEQDPRDEPATELLKRIQAEKARLVRAGKLKESQPLTAIDGSKTPYEIPSSWEWVPLGETVNSHLGGGTPSKNNSSYWDGDIFWASVKDVGKGKYIDKTIDRITKAGLADSSSNLISPGNLIIVTRMGLGKLSINRVSIAINQDLRALSLSNLSAIDYHYMFFKTYGFEGTGLTVKGIRVEELLNMAFPLPPLAEQHRIVAKVDELMALCDRLEAAQAERESWRDRLVASSLNRLNNGAAAFHDHARFYFNHLPRLTTKSEHIQQLRQTILNLAVRGKLVPQDPHDEPAAELLKRIQAEKTKLVKEGKRKRDVELAPVDDTQTPFTLPPSWIWARFPELGIFGRGKSKHRPRNDRTLFDGGTHLLVQTGDVARSKGVIETHTSKYNDIGLAQSMKWPKGTLCITIAANIADSGILSFDACFPDSVVGFIPASEFPSAKYFEYFLRTAKAELLAFAPATAQKNINLEILNSVLIPLPPLVEQQRIVAKVEELMTLCDRLETQLTTTQTESRRLLEAVLVEQLQHDVAPMGG